MVEVLKNFYKNLDMTLQRYHEIIDLLRLNKFVLNA